MFLPPPVLVFSWSLLVPAAEYEIDGTALGTYVRTCALVVVVRKRQHDIGGKTTSSGGRHALPARHRGRNRPTYCLPLNGRPPAPLTRAQPLTEMSGGFGWIRLVGGDGLCNRSSGYPYGLGRTSIFFFFLTLMTRSRPISCPRFGLVPVATPPHPVHSAVLWRMSARWRNWSWSDRKLSRVPWYAHLINGEASSGSAWTTEYVGVVPSARTMANRPFRCTK